SSSCVQNGRPARSLAVPSTSRSSLAGLYWSTFSERRTPCTVVRSLSVTRWNMAPSVPQRRRRRQAVGLPADRFAGQLVIEPGVERLEILHHRARRQRRAGGLAHHVVERPRRTLAQDRAQEVADLLVPVVAARVRVGMQDLLTDVIVELILDRRRDRIL